VKSLDGRLAARGSRLGSRPVDGDVLVERSAGALTS
jgi:hypothetical protein